MSLSGDLLQRILTDTSSFLSSIPSSSYMTSIALACFLWLVGLLCFSTSASSSDNSSKSASRVEAFRHIIQRHIVHPADKHIRTPLQTLLESSSSVYTSSNSKSSSSSSNNKNNRVDSSSPSKSTNLFLSAEALEIAYRDLAPPFNIIMDSENNPDVANHADRSTANNNSMPFIPESDVTHFCFLIHGHRGLSRDLAYFQAVMQRWASEELKKQKQSTGNEKIAFNGNSNLTTTEAKRTHDMVVHNAICNEGKTQDGVENGGERLVEEMRQVIEAEMKKRHAALNREDPDDNNPATNEDSTKIYDITISILGNSLGGLFGRYAIAKLVERYCVKEDPAKFDGKDKPAPSWILDGKFRLHLNIFCTTATPHLGVSGHTWVRIPRTAEIGVAHALGQSGKDLFRLNNLLHTMATSPTFLGPLGSFRKRIAYANCYGTDFAVPVGTAAFLSENSTYPHHFLDDYLVDENGMVIAALHTPAKNDNRDEAVEEHLDELHEMSSSLDKLGWKKVFVDVRKEMPSVELPKSLGERLLRQKKQNSDLEIANSSGSNHSSGSVNETTSDDKIESGQGLQALKRQKIVASKDIANAVRIPEDNRVALPLGHNMIVAFSRSRFTTFMNKGGRPVVDALAKELVDDIFSWDGSNNPPPITIATPSTRHAVSQLVQSSPVCLPTTTSSS
ncbi:DUF676 putative serine esterase domain containing protein [Nitzschia inconspicua]|uniref:DUF676 putative serine esterase domain containing protein n=1 Tax=Nitzschia inconspicua TaxID=303405 RepID=A0A9K3PU58_9STRA|nr:DUF676 putative serine esterase domain containing protein [Nitzschia inconspicua]